MWEKQGLGKVVDAFSHFLEEFITRISHGKSYRWSRLDEIGRTDLANENGGPATPLRDVKHGALVPLDTGLLFRVIFRNLYVERIVGQVYRFHRTFEFTFEWRVTFAYGSLRPKTLEL